MNLDRVTIGIKTILRDDKLFKAILGIYKTMPDVKIAIADDGEQTEKKHQVYEDLIKNGHQVYVLPFDSGFGRKSNVLTAGCKTPYFLVGSDDFDFEPLEVRYGIEKLVEVMDHNEDVDIASGRVNNHHYEFMLVDKGDTIIEAPLFIYKDDPAWFIECDLTVNYSLIRKEVFEKVRWNEDVLIGGGEHASFYIDCKRAGLKTVLVNGVNINEMRIRDDNRYTQLRRRAADAGRPCFQKRGIKKYVLGDGRVDYEEVA